MKLIVILFIAAFAAANGQIKPKQTLAISITGVPVSEQGRLNGSYPVSTDGYIEMWKIGKVRAAGLKSASLASSIAAKFKAAQIYSAPVFQVLNTDEAAEAKRAKEMEESKAARDEQLIEDTKKFTVGGQVNRRGQLQWTEGITLFSAVQDAGGETAFGAINRVKLFRNGQVYTYNLKVDRHKSVKIYPNDIIEVPQKKWNGK